MNSNSKLFHIIMKHSIIDEDVEKIENRKELTNSKEIRNCIHLSKDASSPINNGAWLNPHQV